MTDNSVSHSLSDVTEINPSVYSKLRCSIDDFLPLRRSCS
jgi:hypothetical protein